MAPPADRPLAFHEWPPFAAWLLERGIVWEDASLDQAQVLILEYVATHPEALKFNPTRNPKRPIDPCGLCEVIKTGMDGLLIPAGNQREHQDHVLGAMIDWWVGFNLYRDNSNPVAMVQAFTAACNHNGITASSGLMAQAGPTSKGKVH